MKQSSGFPPGICRFGYILAHLSLQPFFLFRSSMGDLVWGKDRLESEDLRSSLGATFTRSASVSTVESPGAHFPPFGLIIQY